MTAISQPRSVVYKWPTRFRGLGQTCDPTDPTCEQQLLNLPITQPIIATQPETPGFVPGTTGGEGGFILDASTGQLVPVASIGTGASNPVSSTVTPSAPSGGGTPTSGASPLNWNSIIAALIGTAGRTATSAINPLSALSPQAQSAAVNAQLTAATLSAYMPYILLAGGAVLLIALIGSAHK